MKYTPNNIYNHLLTWVPQVTDLFTDEVTPTSAQILAGSPQTLELTSPGHGLQAGAIIGIANTLIDNRIVSVSLVSGILQLTTSKPHDLTAGFTATLLGFTDSQYNGEFEVVNVPTSTTFELDFETLPVLSGNELLRENWSYGLNRPFTIDSVTTNTINILLEGLPEFDELSIPQIKYISNYRFGIVEDVKRLQEIYTKNLPNDLWLYLIMEDYVISKDRNLVSDLNRADTSQTQARIKASATFSIVVIIPTSNDLSASRAVQLAYDELYDLFLGYTSGASFTDGTSYTCSLITHGSIAYNRAYYGHAYTFEQPIEYDYQETFRTNGSITRAFRKIDISFAESQNGSFINLEG